jgi:hypothetical protein
MEDAATSNASVLASAATASSRRGVADRLSGAAERVAASEEYERLPRAFFSSLQLRCHFSSSPSTTSAVAHSHRSSSAVITNTCDGSLRRPACPAARGPGRSRRWRSPPTVIPLAAWTSTRAPPPRDRRTCAADPTAPRWRRRSTGRSPEQLDRTARVRPRGESRQLVEVAPPACPNREFAHAVPAILAGPGSWQAVRFHDPICET